MRYFLFSFFILLIFSCTKPIENNIEFISLKINSWGKSDYNDVTIFIEKEKSNSSVIVQYQNNKDSIISKNFKIDNNSFENLAKQCYELENIDLDKANVIGLDGKNVNIEFGAKGKSLNYIFHEPNSKTQERNLEKFMELSKEILSKGKLDYNLLK